MARRLITAELVRERLVYDPETGVVNYKRKTLGCYDTAEEAHAAYVAAAEKHFGEFARVA